MTAIAPYKRLPNEMKQAIYAYLVPSSVPQLNYISYRTYQEYKNYLISHNTNIPFFKRITEYVRVPPTHYKLLQYLSEKVFKALMKLDREREKQCFSFLLNTNMHAIDGFFAHLEQKAFFYSYRKTFNVFSLGGILFMI